jgi:hypothetical protein
MLRSFGIGAGSLSPKSARAQWCLLRICNKTSIYLRFPIVKDGTRTLALLLTVGEEKPGNRFKYTACSIN